MTRASAWLRVSLVVAGLGGAWGCSEPDEPSEHVGAEHSTTRRAPRVSQAEQEAGLSQCGAFLEGLSPTRPATFSTLMQACAGLYAVASCRDALRAEPFSRPSVHEACSAAYCDELRDPPTFCTRELPSDAEFLAQLADFSERVLDRDLRRVLDDEGAREIASLMAQLIREQSAR